METCDNPRMKSIKLYGTLTSPYVRRVRIVTKELGVDVEWVDTATDEGQEKLREFSPVWKVPAASIEGQSIFASGQINQQLLERYGPKPLAPHELKDVEAQSIIDVIDGALDSLINAFYLSKDGVGREDAPYVEKQHQRAATAMKWLEQKVYGAWLSPTAKFGLPEIALITAMDWMRFRDTYPVEDHPGLLECVEKHRERASVKETAPPQST
jgi:glutathione S-transferase